LPLIFGIGVAFGFAKENRGEVALVGAISYFALILLAQNEHSLSSLFYNKVNLGGGITNFFDKNNVVIGSIKDGVK